MDAKAIDILQKYLGVDTLLYNSVYNHSLRVAEKSKFISDKHPELSADTQFLIEASLLHDVGVVFTNAPDIFCYGKYPYICHGILGREILEREGLNKHALVCERHIGTGLTQNEIIERNLPLPVRDMSPLSIEEKIICFSDLFFSKSKPEKEFTTEDVSTNLAKYGYDGVRIFEMWSSMFL